MVNSEDHDEFEDKNFKRRMDEMLFHEQFWLLLSKKSYKKFIEIEMIYSILRILLDPIKIPIKVTTDLIDQYIAKFESFEEEQINYDQRVRIWSSEEIVKNFKKLNLNNIAYMRTGFLKPKKFEEFQQVLLKSFFFKFFVEIPSFLIFASD